MASSEFRARIDLGLYTLVKAIAPLKNTGKDWTLPFILSEALTEWLLKPENAELIKKHNLLALLEDQDLDIPERIGKAADSGTPE